MPAPRDMRMSMTAEVGRPGLYRLLAWLSPSFPTGAFSYSHGLEAAAAAGAVHNRPSLEGWIAAIIAHGSGRIDAQILRHAHRAAAAGDAAALAAANERGLAYRATAELALESAQQGAAFLAAYEAAWRAPVGTELPNLTPSPLMGEGSGGGDGAASLKAERSPPPRPSPIKGEGDKRGIPVALPLDGGGLCGGDVGYRVELGQTRA